MKSLIEQAKSFLRGRRTAYLKVFDPTISDTITVLEDLAKFCHANRTTTHADSHAQAMLEGRRQVWLRIQQHLQLTDEQLWELYDGRK